MGIIKAAAGAIGGGLADQWLEVIEPEEMGDQTVFTAGTAARRGANTKGSSNTVSNGSMIHVYPNQFMMLVDGGKVIDYTAEEGYYKVSNSSLPSLFNGQFGETLRESFDRIRYGGVTPTVQKVYYINLQEIKGIKFGTRNPINYFDSFYNAELFLRAHGTYSIKITDPLLFYREGNIVDARPVDVGDIHLLHGAFGSYAHAHLLLARVRRDAPRTDGFALKFYFVLHRHVFCGLRDGEEKFQFPFVGVRRHAEGG